MRAWAVLISVCVKQCVSTHAGISTLNLSSARWPDNIQQWHNYFLCTKCRSEISGSKKRDSRNHEHTTARSYESFSAHNAIHVIDSYCHKLNRRVFINKSFFRVEASLVDSVPLLTSVRATSNIGARESVPWNSGTQSTHKMGSLWLSFFFSFVFSATSSPFTA